MDFMLGGPMHRATVTMMALIFGARTAVDPYARMMMPPLRNNKSIAVSTIISMRTITFWVCFVAVALAYSKRTISVDVWQSILKRPTTPTKMKHGTARNSDESFQVTIEVVYALCRKLVRYAIDALEKAKQQRNRGGAEPPPPQEDEQHDDLSPAQHRGSCHCGAVKFVVFAAKTLYVESTTSTSTISTDPQQCRRILPYEYARINNTSLTWDEGHVQSYDSRYFFCPSCGVHLAHAVVTTSSTNNNAAANEMIQLFINVDCLDGSSYILRPVSSRPQEATTTNLFAGRRPLDVPLTVPVPVVADQRHHATLVSECASTIAGTQQRQQQPPPRHSPSSPSVSALDDDLEYMSTTADNNDVRSINLLGTTTTTAAASVASGQTTEELAVTAYRLRKALLSHTATSSSTATTTTATTTKTSSSPTSPALMNDSQTKGDDDDDDKNDDDDDDDDNSSSQPDAASSPTTHESSKRSPKASVPIYHNRCEPAEEEESLVPITPDAEKLRRYLGKHNGGG
jgi:hypothetical protein